MTSVKERRKSIGAPRGVSVRIAEVAPATHLKTTPGERDAPLDAAPRRPSP
jgi:hypothetical protein